MRELQGGATFATYLTGPTGPLYRRDATGETLRWYIYDGLGSVLGEVDASGNLDATRTYDVYGLARSVTGTPTNKHGLVGALGHTAEDETGLVYMRARYYDPTTGRFLSEDPARMGIDWFVYANDDAVNCTDGSGASAAGLLQELALEFDVNGDATAASVWGQLSSEAEGYSEEAVGQWLETVARDTFADDLGDAVKSATQLRIGQGASAAGVPLAGELKEIKSGVDLYQRVKDLAMGMQILYVAYYLQAMGPDA